ncbi:hypothetical protein MVEG_02256 [Podila verticillata NRRL 6337]|nr:hypothetical protein MVEG_02256 [Podila verticillata NRRL 6337]
MTAHNRHRLDQMILRNPPPVPDFAMDSLMPTEQLVEIIDLPDEPDTYLGTVEGTPSPCVANTVSLEVSPSAIYPSMLNTEMALIAASTSPVSSHTPQANLLTSTLSSNVAPNSALSPWSGDYLGLNGHYESSHVPELAYSV